MDGIVIRELTYTETDRAMVVDFYNRIGPEGTQLFNPQSCNFKRMEKFFEKKDKGTVAYFIAEEDGVMMGLVFLAQMNKLIPTLGIAIAADHKGKHLGTRLMEFIMEYARKKEKGGVLLSTHIANIRGQALYEKCGFEHLGMRSSIEIQYIYKFDDKKFRFKTFDKE